MIYPSLDPQSYPQSLTSQPLHVGVVDGNYVYVQDLAGTIYILPDGYHQHPRVLGESKPAKYAGELVLKQGMVMLLNNCSGTFEPDCLSGLCEVAEAIEMIGFEFRARAIQFFHFRKIAPTKTVFRGRRDDANSGS